MALDCLEDYSSIIYLSVRPITMADNNMQELLCLIGLRNGPENITQAGTNIPSQEETRLRQVENCATADSQVPHSNAPTVEPDAEQARATAPSFTDLSQIDLERVFVMLIIINKLVDKLLELSPKVKALFAMWGVNHTVVLVAATDLAVILYIKQRVTIQLEYNQNIQETLQNAMEQNHFQQKYDDGNTELNLDINKAVATLKSKKRWAVSQYLAKWMFGGLVLGAGSYEAICGKTGSWLDWGSCALGATAMGGAIGLACGLYKLNSSEEQNKLKKITDDIETLQERVKKFNRSKKNPGHGASELEVSSSGAYPNEDLPSLRDPRSSVFEKARSASSQHPSDSLTVDDC